MLDRARRRVKIASTRSEIQRLFGVIAGLLVLSGCTPAPPAPPAPHAPHAPHAPSASRALAVPTEAELSKRPALVRDWGDRLLSDDANVRAATADVLVQAGARSIPLIRRLLRTRDEDLHVEAINVLHRLGPDAIGLLTELLADRRVWMRRHSIDLLVDLAPDTESIQPALRRALKDEDVEVARDAARALGALGERAAPSAPSLVEALSHRDSHVRVYAAEALASIGTAAAGPSSTIALAKLLNDPVPKVRWAACEALASFGPDAIPAVPALIHALGDDYLYVRICAVDALDSMGPIESPELDALKRAATQPTLRAGAQPAITRMAGSKSPAAQPATRSLRARDNPPTDWDIRTQRNIAWSVELGGETLGRPVVSDGMVYVGTDNARKLNPRFTDECGVLMAFRATDGAFLWQDMAPRVNRGLGEFLLPSTTSAPYVEGDRLYYVTAECQLRCLDARSGKLVWELDMCGQLGVFPHEASNSDVLPVGDLLIVCTSNGRNEAHTRVPSPRAPSLIAVNKSSGTVVWQALGAGGDVLHGQWCSPAAANVNGQTQVLFGGGDGWLRGYDAASGREIWRFDGNPKDARYLPRPGTFSRSPIVASPVYEDGRVFIAMGDDPSHGNGPSLLHAVSPTSQGDVTERKCLWTSREIGRVVGTPVAQDGLLYVGDLGGTIWCFDAATGALVWKHETDAPIWGCLMLAGDRLYAGNVNGVMTVLRAGRTKQVLAEIEMDSALYSRPALVGDTLYLATARRLYFIAARP